MGLFWDLIQQSQISDQRTRSDSLESRVAQLEHELTETRRIVSLLLERLENYLGEDIDKDGTVGTR